MRARDEGVRISYLGWAAAAGGIVVLILAIVLTAPTRARVSIERPSPTPAPSSPSSAACPSGAPAAYVTSLDGRTRSGDARTWTITAHGTIVNDTSSTVAVSSLKLTLVLVNGSTVPLQPATLTATVAPHAQAAWLVGPADVRLPAKPKDGTVAVGDWRWTDRPSGCAPGAPR
jgi:hypothetical protein